jgi:hypothetical protein
MDYGKKTGLTVILFLLAVGVVFFVNRQDNKPIVESPASGQSALNNSRQPPLTQREGENPSSTLDSQYIIPNTILLNVPFTPQAPRANWVEPFKESCEEASALMAGEYFSGNASEKLEAGYAQTEILKLVDWEQERFGYHLDIDTGETAEVLRQVHGLNTKILGDFTEEALKKELAQGRLILLPADGRKLHNPNFKRPGPPYHMLVLKGYNDAGFITNDPGTRNGLSYSYEFETLYGANGNWSHETRTVDLNEKMAIVAWK